MNASDEHEDALGQDTEELEMRVCWHGTYGRQCTWYFRHEPWTSNTSGSCSYCVVHASLTIFSSIYLQDDTVSLLVKDHKAPPIQIFNPET